MCKVEPSHELLGFLVLLQLQWLASFFVTQGSPKNELCLEFETGYFKVTYDKILRNLKLEI